MTRGLLERHPDSGLLWKTLAAALQVQGKDALPALQRAADLLPSDAAAHQNLADTLQALGRYTDAVASYERALQCKPDFADAHNNLGSALRSLGRLDEAVASFRRALEVKADFAKAHGNLANVLRMQGHHSAAEASCARALTLNPHLAPTLVLLSELKADRGKFEDALVLLERAIAIEPRLPQAWAGLARWRTLSRDDQDWLTRAQQIADSSLPVRTEVLMRYAIGKYFADVRAFERAFASYHRANELERGYKDKHHRERLTQAVDLLIRTYDRAWLARPRPEASTSPRPVFIVGMARSGTTLVEQILASHPQVFGAGELPFWETALETHELAVLHPKTGNATLRRLADEYLHRLQTLSPDAERVIDKMPGNFMFLGWIQAALPQARIIHMRRDPIDTCLSIYFQHFETAPAYTNDLGDLAHYYREYSRLMAHWREVLPAGAMLEVPYEALLEDQEGWSRRLLEFIDLPWDARCMDFHRTERAIVTASKFQVRQKLNRTSVGRWRDYADFIGPLRELASL